jgi:hypothetical protein
MKTQNPLEDLILLSYNAEGLTPEQRQYALTSDMMYVDGCTKKKLIGTREQLGSIPENIRESSEIFEGEEAYQHLVEVAAGLWSRARGESQIVGQCKRALTQYQEKAPTHAKSIETVIRWSLTDAGTIRNHQTSKLRPAFFENAAHKIANQKAGDVAAIVVSGQPGKNTPSNIAKNIAKALGNNRKDRVKKLIITSPDQEVLKNAHSFFHRARERKLIVSDIEIIPFDELMDASGPLQWVKQLFVTTKMGENPEADAKIIDQWSHKEVYGGMLVHLGGPRNGDRYSNDMWSNSGLHYYISPEEIIAQQKESHKTNDALVDLGKNAARNCALSRARNKRPIAKELSLPEEKYLERIGLSKGGRVIC